MIQPYYILVLQFFAQKLKGYLFYQKKYKTKKPHLLGEIQHFL